MNRKQRRITGKQGGNGASGLGRPVSVDPGIYIGDLFADALRDFQAGRLLEAEANLRRILAVAPDNVDGLHLLGVIAARGGRYDAAVELISRVTAIRPTFADAHFNLGRAYRDLDRLDDAVACYRRALAIRPNDGDVHYSLGNALRDQGELDDAAACYRRALAIKPDYAEAYGNLGNILLDQGKLDDAAACYRQALAIKPDYAEAHCNLGHALRDQGNLDEAVVCLQRAIAIKPNFAAAHSNLGNALRGQDKLDQATACYKRAIAIDPDLAEAHFNLGNVLRDQGKLDDATASYRQALAIKPDYAWAYNNLGTALSGKGKLDDAAACYRYALAIKPDFAGAHMNLGMLRLQQGDFAAGWREYEWRRRGGARNLTMRPFTQPEWRGESLGGRTILLHAEQGLGDAIQFARYATVAANRGGRVILELPRPLLRLLATVDGVAEIVASGEALPPLDCQLPLMSVPGAVGTTLATIPAGVPYLSADAAAVARWAARLAGIEGLKLGLVWAGNPTLHDPEANAIDRRRSIALARLAPLLAVPGVTFISLQKGRGAAQLVELAPELRPLDFMAEIDDFADTAALVANLDLVITVDTSVAHLAGAMAKPVWILSRFDGCWRWLLERDDSPWYPTARLFRQTRPGDWETVIAGAAGKLAEVATGRLAAVWPLAGPTA